VTLGMPVGICIAAAVLVAGGPALGSTSLAIVGDPGYGGAAVTGTTSRNVRLGSVSSR